jgi:penicillin-binding protein 2
VNLLQSPRLRQRLTRNPLERDDSKFATGRIAVFQYLMVIVFLFLVSGFWDLQVQNPELYSERAEKNKIKALPILAPRGKILDRDGRVIVDRARI